MRVLDLFCGLKGWSQAFTDRAHSVVTVDIDERFDSTLTIDVNLLHPNNFSGWKPDVVLASPPCTHFSIASIRTHWLPDYRPTDETQAQIALVKHTLLLIRELNPQFWILENPVGMLRKIIGKPTCTITQCQYGEKRMKPTDLWGHLPQAFTPKRCHNGDSCHISTPRGCHRRDGTQMLGAEIAAKIPYGLSLEMCLACERDLSVD